MGFAHFSESMVSLSKRPVSLCYSFCIATFCVTVELERLIVLCGLQNSNWEY